MAMADDNELRRELDRVGQELEAFRAERARLENSMLQLEKRRRGLAPPSEAAGSTPEGDALQEGAERASTGAAEHAGPTGAPQAPDGERRPDNLRHKLRKLTDSETLPRFLGDCRTCSRRLRNGIEWFDRGIDSVDNVVAGIREAREKGQAALELGAFGHLPREALGEVLRSPEFRKLMISVAAHLLYGTPGK